MIDLPVCPKCGWHKTFLHEEECCPVAGAVADRIAALTRIPSTKLGYGFGKLTFEFDAARSLTLGFHRDGSFYVGRFHWNSKIDTPGVVKLVTALAGCAQGDK